jgi:hypothetical protein
LRFERRRQTLKKSDNSLNLHAKPIKLLQNRFHSKPLHYLPLKPLRLQ